MTALVCLFRHPNVLLVCHVRNVIDSAGIVVELRNMTLAGAAGELPMDQCEPQVWVARAEYERAWVLLHEALEGPADVPADWVCPGCGERLAGAFDTCWQCAAPRPPAGSAPA
ncbi:DUF2007 domain-containing protein [Salinicola sp. RZ23]|uniref:putative signal transducing protein n=1 Tax=Salinicola sp. RZ23 TaxID=1949087 RepID=UPI000DA257A4|nr:DUF2007 domain-containing protein [Salinicola sp. RZ23]